MFPASTVRRSGAATAMIATALAAAPAGACTLCHSDIAGEVRAAVFGAAFWPHMAVVAAPLPMLLAAVIALRRYLP